VKRGFLESLFAIFQGKVAPFMMNEEFTPTEAIGRSLMRELYDWVEAGIVAVVCVIILFTFGIRMAGVDGASMNPTLHDQDLLVISRMLYQPVCGDIVVITKPNHQQKPLIKRVIATEGQTVDIDFDKGVVYVDGAALQEPYTAEPTYHSYDMVFPQTVPQGCVFAMGDNRNESWDSRAAEVGMIDARYILGKVIYRILPYNQMGIPQ